MKGDKSAKGAKKMSKEKIIYKNQKRRVRNRLIYLVGVHIFFIFVFCGFMSVEHLVDWGWGDAQSYSLASDCIYLAYFIETLAAIKFKHRKLLLFSIFTLSLAIGTKTASLFILFREANDLRILMTVHLLLLALNFAIPICLLFLWNKLKTEKWRETFDLYTKLNSHLDKETAKAGSEQIVAE